MKNRTSKNRYLYKAIAYLFNYKKYLSMTIMLMLFLVGLRLIRPLLMKYAIDNYIVTKDLPGLTSITILFLTILVFEFALTYFQTYLTQLISQQSLAQLREDVFSKIIHQKMTFFDKNKTGSLLSRTTTDINNLQEMLSMGLLDSILKIINIIFIIIILFTLNTKLAFFTLLFFPFSLIIFYFFSTYVFEKYKNLRVVSAKLSGILQENISGMAIIQLFNQEIKHFDEFEKTNRDLYDLHHNVIFSFSIFFPIIEIFTSLSIALILWRGGIQVFVGSITIGTLVAFINYIQNLFAPLMDLSERFNVMQKSAASAQRIFTLIEDEQQTIPDGNILKENTEGNITLKNVWFKYNDQWILKRINISINAGEKVAIVGATGSGKSTLLKLLLRLYETNKGEILLDGINISSFRKDTLRKHFGYILQDPLIFSDTIEKNISLFNEEISLDKISTACKMSGSDKFIKKLPDQYEHLLDEKGANLSTGEKQLLALSRMVAYSPEIFLLDEATSNIDVITEHIIEKYLPKIMNQRTSIIVAHRLSTLKSVDRIIVLHNGEIIEDGTHHDLMKIKGQYYKLYKYQYATK